MSTLPPTGGLAFLPTWGGMASDGLDLGRAATAYAVDAWQRCLLYADLRRQRGNQFYARLEESAPTVLEFEADLVMSGDKLPEPVNYWLLRIRPAEGTPVDEGKRPFVVVDPRAGHGPGIGGFKPDSEIGAALRAGHPCYFVGFLPVPVAGQTLDHVLRAQNAFLARVAALHPHSIGKPVVIGNCQAGWQVMMSAAIAPELFGPIILAGAPMSYWAGGKPMRLAGGMLGGSWLTALTSDLGAGRFDGAWLVQNFENLDPGNTLWTKQYTVYSQVDTEGPRYLGFERYWGGYVFLNGGEIQTIVDKLFIGNKLSTAVLRTDAGQRIDLRKIRSPVIVFCSYGDNITPPPQALGWITDLYRTDQEVADHDQTIVFATHQSIGHLGIFVSGSVGRKEHREFAANIDGIDLLPSGIYRAEVAGDPDAIDADPRDPTWLMTVRASSVAEVAAIVKPDPAGERRFATAARVSDINHALYRNTLQPWVRALSTPQTAQWLQALHPMRTGFSLWSDRHPLAPLVAALAPRVAEARQPVAADNPWLLAQEAWSRATVELLDGWRDRRDAMTAAMFDAIYGAPLLQAMVGIDPDAVVRPHPGASPAHLERMAQARAGMHAGLREGGLAEAFVRGLNHVFAARGQANGHQLRHGWDVLRPHLAPIDAPGPGISRMDAFRAINRRQAELARHDPEGALEAIPYLLRDVSSDRVIRTLEAIEGITGDGVHLSECEVERMARVRSLFEQALEGRAGTDGGAGAERKRKRKG